MKGIRFAIISILVLFGLITAVGMLFSSHVTVIRQVDIQAPKDSIEKNISDINNWHKWMIDTSVQIAFFTKNTQGVNASAQIAKSRVTITKIDSIHINTEWAGTRGNPQMSGFTIIPSTSVPNAYTVQWYFTQKLDWYPWQRIGATLNEKILGPSMEKSLDKLKKTSEGE
ncbi:SRPBCC family protein [Rhizosphaericola mali]|uniref:SRPBCC family protein n=1 Tax=Rhizosphaericola mali TaxID=2545455 RepID=A0A5P2GFP6_9BACT|nr:SRPBCC family protein [Rhizosphaericola mali]QES90451.1 hypothetical protein E0W69_017915 [Rhizosphaericola mali]